MKRLSSLLIALMLALSMSPAVHADMIHIPEEDFLGDHKEECTGIDRNYRALKDLTLYQNPQNDNVEGSVPKGGIVRVYYVWTDPNDHEWAYLRYEEYGSGWAPLAYLELVYDNISFFEDYGGQFTYLDKFLKMDLPTLEQRIWFWNYPGSEEGEQHIAYAAYPLEYGITYTDPDGRVWGYITDYRGNIDVWVCLSDPTASFKALYPNGAPEVDITQPGETKPPLPNEEIRPTRSPKLLGTATVITVCTVAATLILFRLKKQNG